MKTTFRLQALLAVLPLIALVLLCATVPATTSAFTAKVTTSTNSAASNPYFACSSVFTAYSQTNTYFEYALNEASNSTFAADDSGTAARRGTYRGTMTTSTTGPLACPASSGGAYQLNGTTSYVSTPTAVNNPTTFSVSTWFKTTTPQGVLIGFGNTATGDATAYDRALYLTADGQLAFGIYNSTVQVLTTTATYTDGLWHQATATLSPTGGMALYVDGAPAGSNASYTTPGNYSGYWRIGFTTITGAPNAPTSGYFKGQLRYAAAFRSVLSAAEVKAQYIAGK